MRSWEKRGKHGTTYTSSFDMARSVSFPWLNGFTEGWPGLNCFASVRFQRRPANEGTLKQELHELRFGKKGWAPGIFSVSEECAMQAVRENFIPAHENTHSIPAQQWIMTTSSLGCQTGRHIQHGNKETTKKQRNKAKQKEYPFFLIPPFSINTPVIHWSL